MRYLNEIQQYLESLQRRDGSLAAAIRGLDAALAEHRAELHPQLQHYLSQRSYDKALAWVNAELAEADSAPAATLKHNPAFAPPPGGCSGRRS